MRFVYCTKYWSVLVRNDCIIYIIDSLVVTGGAAVVGLGTSMTKIEGHNNSLTVIVKNLCVHVSLSMCVYVHT